MLISRVSIKGQGAISAEFKRRRLSELYGVLPPIREFPGTEVVREEVGRALGRELENRTKIFADQDERVQPGGLIMKPVS